MTEPEKLSGDNDREAAPVEASTAPDDMDTVKRILEAILFASSDPVPLRKMRSAIGKPASDRVKDALAVLTEDYQKGSRGMEIEEVAGGFRMVTSPDYSPWVLKVRAPKKDDRVSPAALETLAIIAYKQPIPRAEVDAIRGVNSGELLRRFFGLKRLEDLPKGEWEREGAKPGSLPQASKE